MECTTDINLVCKAEFKNIKEDIEGLSFKIEQLERGDQLIREAIVKISENTDTTKEYLRELKNDAKSQQKRIDQLSQDVAVVKHVVLKEGKSYNKEKNNTISNSKHIWEILYNATKSQIFWAIALLVVSTYLGYRLPDIIALITDIVRCF